MSLKYVFGWFILMLSFFTEPLQAYRGSAKENPIYKYEYKLSACSLFRDEARFLKEWIEYHKLVGVEHFYLYNNLSDDDYISVLAPYVESGVVELIEWPYPSHNISEYSPIQRACYEDVLKRALGKTEWLAIIDSDEFILPVQEDNLVTFLSKYKSVGGVIANWQLFGTSGVEEVPADKLMIEVLINKAPTEHDENRFVKSIVQPHRVASLGDPHFCNFKPGFPPVNSSFQIFPWSTTPVIVVDKIRINHYWTRDNKFLREVKVARRQAWGEGIDGIFQRATTLNRVPDDVILRFVPELRKRMGLE